MHYEVILARAFVNGDDQIGVVALKINMMLGQM